MREFDFSQENLRRIGREYRRRRKDLQYAKSSLEWAEGAAAKGYTKVDADRFVKLGKEALAKAEAAFAEIKAERADYQARGFCR